MAELTVEARHATWLARLAGELNVAVILDGSLRRTEDFALLDEYQGRRPADATSRCWSARRWARARS